MARTSQVLVSTQKQTPTKAPAEAAIVVQGLAKTYPNGTEAVRGVSFTVKRGEIFGILGPNGAGKSTTLGMMGTLVKPTRGHVTILGMRVDNTNRALRQQIGFALQEAGVDDLATGREFLAVQGGLYGLPRGAVRQRTQELLQLFELEEAADKRIKSYSGGMQRRIDLAAALLHDPPVLFLDEPTEGLDPRSRKALWATLLRLRETKGTTIVLSTHYMEEADHLCDRLAIVDGGRIVALDTPARLKAAIGTDRIHVEVATAPGQARLRSLQDAFGASNVRVQGTAIELRVKTASTALVPALSILAKQGLVVTQTHVQRPTLDDVYLQATGKRLEEDAA